MIKDSLILLRKTKGYSQETVASLLNISRQSYGKWERGESVPDINKCYEIANLYNISLDCLVKGNIVSDRKTLFCSVSVDEKGKISLPETARNLLSLGQGSILYLYGIEDEGLFLVKDIDKKILKLMDKVRYEEIKNDKEI